MLIKIILLIFGIILIAFSACVFFAQAVFDLCFKRVKDAEASIEKGIRHIESGGGNGSAIRAGREWMLSQNVEHHYIISRDGLRLHGIFIPNKDEQFNRVAVLVHGYQGAPSFDFSAVAKFYFDNGFSLFLPDQRTHGESEGEYITFGSFERYDIVDWCKYIDNYTENKCEFILSGVSMGATTVLLAAAEPDMIKLNYITADCGFTDPQRIFTDVFRQWYHLPSFPILNIARVICRDSAKFDFNEFSTLDAVKELPAPVTFIHGEADTFVIPQNSLDNYAACTGIKNIITVPGAAHGLSYIVEPELIEKELSSIFNNYFS